MVMRHNVLSHFGWRLGWVHRSLGFSAPCGFHCFDCDAAAMTAETKGSAVSRRDLLVQQLLEERRQRLQQKLAAGPVQEEREREETALEHLEPLECSFNSFNSQENLSPKRNVRTFAEKDFRPMEPRDDGFLTSVLARLKAAEAELQPPPVPEPVATATVPKAAHQGSQG